MGSNTKTSTPALSNNIKYVSIQWLIDLMKNKGKCNIENYLVLIEEEPKNNENADINK